jgi:hypothetical protein
MRFYGVTHEHLQLPRDQVGATHWAAPRRCEAFTNAEARALCACMLVCMYRRPG